MASGAMIGALRVTLGADTAEFADGFKAAEKSLSRFNANMGKLGAAIGVAVAGAAVALGAAIKHTSEEIDKLGKTAQSIGVPIEELSKLKYAADLSGLSLEGLSTGVGKLAKNMSEFAGGSDEAGKSFRALGISVKDASGNLRPISEVIADVAGKFGTMEDGAGKTALAMSLFGKSGKDLIPLLNSGSAGLREMYKEAEQLGLVITEKTFKAAEAFNDNLTRLGRVKDGFVIGITAQMLPALQALTGAWVTAAKEAGGVARVGEVANRVISDGVTNVVTAIVIWERFAATYSAVKALVAAQPATSGMEKFLSDATNSLAQFNDKFLSSILPTTKEWGNAWDKVWNSISSADPGTVLYGWQEFRNVMNDNKKAFEEIPARAAAMLQSFQQVGAGALDLAGKTKPPVIAAKDFQKALDDLRIKTMETQGAFAGLAPGFVQQAISLNIMDAATAKAGISVAGLTQQQKQLNDAMLAFRGSQVTQENLLPWQKLNQEMQLLGVLLASRAIDMATFQRAAQKAAEAAGATWHQFGNNVAQVFVSLGQAFGKTSKEIFMIGKAAAIAQAIINTYQGATKALAELPPPFNFAAAAAVVAAGMANVAQIQSQQFTGAAMGGSFMVPGGISRSDNRLIPMALAAGERVDVTPAGGGGRKEQVIRIDGLRGPGSVPRDQAVAMLEALNDLLDDNYKLRVN